MKRPQNIINQAAQRLDTASYNPRKLVLIHSGAALGFAFVLTALNFAISQGVGNTGGLSGMGMRAILETIRTLLQYASMILQPFWQIGFLAAAVAIARNQRFGVPTLLQGFRRFASVLGLLFAEGFGAIIIAFTCAYISSGIFMVTPYAQPFMDAIAPALEEASLLSGGQVYLDETVLAAAMETMTPMLLIFAAVYLLVLIPISYRVRLAEFILMDQPHCSGLRALFTSFRLMRRNCLRLLRLDLQFWWFYVLQTLALVIGYGDVLLPALGVALPIHTDLAFFLFYILHLAIQLALHVWMKAKMQTSYALFYDSLLASIPQPKPQPQPKNLPWDYQ